MGRELRKAVASDIEALRLLDRLAFPPGELDREPAHPGELEAGLERGQFTVCEIDGVVVGMLQSEHLEPDHVYLAALAVHPDHQGKHVGHELVADFVANVERMDPRPSVTTVTSPSNVAMISLLVNQGFIVRTAMRNYFGPGKDRVYCQLKTRRQVVAPDDRVLVPVEATGHVFDLLAHEEYAITDVLASVQGKLFELSRFDPEDRQGLKADEASISVSESGAVAAALTFLLGLSFAVPDYSEPLRILILVATILTVGSLQIYANASGSLARIKDDSFDRHMKWGNLLLEFGGVLPLVIVLPAVFARASDNFALSFSVAVIVSLTIGAYEYSSFAISARYRHGVVFHILVGATVALPLVAAPLFAVTGRDTLWVALVGLVMALRLLWLVPASQREFAVRPRRRFLWAKRPRVYR